MIYNQNQNIAHSGGNAASVRSNSDAISLKNSMLISTGMHFLTPLLIWAILFILALLGIHLVMFNPPKPKIKDIEFKIVQAPEQKPLTNTRNRADRDSRAGGKHDPKKPESEPQPKAAPKSQSKAQPKPKPKPQVKPQPKPQPKAQPKQQPKPQVKPKPQQPKPNPKPPMPVPPTAKAPKPKLPKNPMAPPINIASAPKPVGPSSSVGPITSNTSTSSSSSSGTSGPAPITMNSPTSSSSSGYPGSSSKSSSGSSHYGSGNPGNPSAGNPSGAPGINARKDPDFGPYMAELQRRIKRNWAPPRRNQSKRVIVLFTVAKDGRLLNLRIYKSSGEPPTDRAAISAVQLSAPFRPLPREFSGNQIDIQFTFDYNVFGVGGRSF